VLEKGIYCDYDPLRPARGVGMSVMDRRDLGPGRHRKQSNRLPFASIRRAAFAGEVKKVKITVPAGKVMALRGKTG
jgi:hypothetical protein